MASRMTLHFLFVILAAAPRLHCLGNDNWVNHGNGILNQRSAIGPNEKITNETVSKLNVKWRFKTGFDVSATPSVAEGMVYFPGNGMLYAVKEETGQLIWKSNLTELAGGLTEGSRATPVVWEDVVLVGLLGPAVILAVNRYSGQLVWKSQPLDSSNLAVITMSGTAYQGYYYVGVSSFQEYSSTCCTFQGSFQKLLIKDGSVVWRTSMLPQNSGYYGAAVWGSSPSIDEKQRLVFIATGNNYKVPESVDDCENSRSNSSIETELDPCLDPLNHQDSMVALNIDTGNIVWSRNLQAYDVWTHTCELAPSTSNCPSVLGPDYDFGEAPLIIYLDTPNKHTSSCNRTCLVVAGQKSGVIWALDCDTGSLIWSTVAGPGGVLGGASWGLSTDGQRVYTNIINSQGSNFTLVPGNELTQGGGWVAMQASSGKVVWSIAEPSGVFAFGPTSVAKGVVFGTSFTDAGDIYAMDALTGNFLWHSTTGAGMYGGASISKSCIFVGNGHHFEILKQNGTFLTAFCLPKIF